MSAESMKMMESDKVFDTLRQRGSLPFTPGDMVRITGYAAHGVGAAFADLLDRELAEIREMLVAKNQAYGNSALDPVRIFSKADPVEQIKVRLDDKISRLSRGEAAGEDVETDLIGYLFLLRIARRMCADAPKAWASEAHEEKS